jgi:hypothetical protein
VALDVNGGMNMTVRCESEMKPFFRLRHVYRRGEVRLMGVEEAERG